MRAFWGIAPIVVNPELSRDGACLLILPSQSHHVDSLPGVLARYFRNGRFQPQKGRTPLPSLPLGIELRAAQPP